MELLYYMCIFCLASQLVPFCYLSSYAGGNLENLFIIISHKMLSDWNVRVYKKFIIPNEPLKRRKTDAIGFVHLSPLSPVGLTYCSELNDYLRKVLFFEETPNQHLNTYSLKYFTDSFSWGLSEGKKGEISEMLNTCHKLRVEMNEQYMQLWSINQKTTNGCYSSKCIWSNMNKGNVSLTVFFVCVCIYLWAPKSELLGREKGQAFLLTWMKWSTSKTGRCLWPG